MPRLLIAAGASGGHIYPAVALAEALLRRKDSWQIAFISRKSHPIEGYLKNQRCPVFAVSSANIFASIVNLKCGNPGVYLLKILRSLYYFIKGFLESLIIVGRFRPDVVAGFGSYVSFPAVFVASLLKKSAVIHEQNVSLGLANRFLSIFADKVALSFKETKVNNFSDKPVRQWFGFPNSQSHKYVFTGNPLRDSLVKTDKQTARDFFNLENKFTILVLGGSQGARRVNAEFKKAVFLLEKECDFQFIHIAGNLDYFNLKRDYSCIKIKYSLFDFLFEMHLAYSLADLVIARAGAGTIFELAYFGKAAILIPYPYAGSHQLENAFTLSRKGAALVIQEKDFDGLVLKENILRLIGSSCERQNLQTNITKFLVKDADVRLANLISSVVRDRK